MKAVDVGRPTPPTLADLLVEETLHDPGAVEVGHADGLRWTVTLEERPRPASRARAWSSGPTPCSS